MPVKSATANVYVTIRDNRAPRFSSPVYNASITENVNIGEIVKTVSANDPDGDSITYSIKVRLGVLTTLCK